MRKTSGKSKMVTILLMVLFCTVTSFAGIHHEHRTIKTTYGGTPVVIGQPEATMTVNPVITIFPHTDVAVTNLLTLGVNHNYKGYFTAMEVKVTIELEQFDVNMVSYSNSDIDLTIKYDPFSGNTFIDKNTYKFTGAYKFIAKIKAIEVDGVPGATELPGNLFIDGDIFIERYFSFVTASNPIVMHPINLTDETQMIDTDCDLLVDEFEISWPTIIGAEEYQLEWTFVNDYGKHDTYFRDPDSLEFDFRNNATRITTSYNYYRITNAFEHGYVVFRVRAIGRNLNNLSEIITGVWSSPDIGQVSANPFRIPISEYDENNPDPQIVVHEGNKNWQFSTTFAEEGKKKDVVSYFDGSLRNRQTVTKINSDNNTIVGETIYDHQGRPAVTVLPVPVVDPNCSDPLIQESAIKFYPNFNKSAFDESGYSRLDFDISDAGEECIVEANGMSINSGSSQYYSINNPDRDGIQAYVPDAQLYPFTQVEYTPDNTGRIRRQSGVGEDFKLGSGHETKYFYGQPNQIQLDRLFGSEVGDAAHYKKNLVFDPNGQASVSYLDQEGRVVATALAGSAPTNLTAISSGLTANVPLTIDLFSKDAEGSSNTNEVNPEGNGIEFTTQLLVAYETDFFIDYSLSVAPFQDDCLAEEFCFSCVYDLRIEVRDECGLRVNEKINKMIGRFETDEITGEIEFITECDESTFIHNESVTDGGLNLHLTPGNYSVSKILTVNEDARDFYLDAYVNGGITDPDCIKTLEEFQEEYLSQIDLSDCAITCDVCVESLGERDDFVSQGKGTALEYDLLVEQCMEPCKDVSLCEASYQMMLADVSPGGQYAEFLTSNNVFDPSSFVLSVLNVPNALPQGGISNWKHPNASINGNFHTGYFDEDGTRSRIIMTMDINGNFSPQTDNHSINTPSNTTGDIFLDADTQEFFTYPENLVNVSDFISFFQPSWAKSLVTYHPEYCYYETCLGYGVKKGEDEFSSESFDNILIRTNTYNDAVTQGLIDPSNPTAFTWFDSNNINGDPWDPFVVNAADFDNYGLQLQDKFDNYYDDGTTVYNMAQFAAMTIRCGGNIGITPLPYCYEFGTGTDVDILDQEWLMLKNFYRSAKQQLQNERVKQIAIHECPSFNGCIGEENYHPHTAGLFTNVNQWPWYNNQPYFSYAQPCGAHSWWWYRNKVKRFPTENDIPNQNPTDIAYQHYLMTGQCPNAFSLQNLLSAVASNDALNTYEQLNSYPELMSVLLAANNYTITNPVPTVSWVPSSSILPMLEVELWNETDNVKLCNLSLDVSGSSNINSWSDIVGIINLESTNQNMPSEFDAIALVQTPGGIIHENISGRINCINLFDCRFNTNCDANQFALDMEMLMTVLAINGELTGSEIDLEVDPYTVPANNNFTGFALATPLIKEVASGTNTSSLEWNYNSTSHIFSITNNQNSDVLEFAIESLEPNTFNLSNLSQIYSFGNVVSEWSNAFAIDAFDANGNLLVTIHGSVVLNDGNEISPVSMGECALPDALTCEGEGFEALHELDNLLKDVLLTQDFVSDINLFGSVYWTPLLHSYLGLEITSTSSTYTHTYDFDDDLHTDALDFDMEGCHLTLTHIDKVDLPKDFTHMIGMSDLVAIGEADEEGNMFEFYFLATYEYDGIRYTDTVFGSTCYPLRNCSECPDVPKKPREKMELAEIEAHDQEMLDEGVTKENVSVEIYEEYVETVDELNLRMGWNPGDSLYVSKMDYVDYFHEGMHYPGKSYIRQMKYYDVDIDDHNLIRHADSFAVKYGSGTNVKIEHQRYKKAVERYNQRAVSANLPEMEIMEDTTFAKLDVADSIGIYIEYIEQMPISNQEAEEPLDYLISQQAITINSDVVCQEAYSFYVNAWQEFQFQQSINTTCLHHEIFSPLYSYDNFVSNNLCCSQEGLDLIQQYINAFNSGTDCPGSLPMLEDCNGGREDTKGCQEKFIFYRNTVTNFNNSAWAIANEVQISVGYETYEAFVRDGKCECLQAWLNYILPYIRASASDILPPVQSLNEFPACQEFVVTGENPCEEEYEQYLNCVAIYNAWTIETEKNKNYRVNLVTYSEFLNNDLCHCADAYCTALNNIMDGIITDQKEIAFALSIIRVCDITTSVPCTPEFTLNTTFVSPPAPESNPCEEYMIDMAMMNGENAYNLYIDSLLNEIASAYDQHCLSALETFNATYTDKEYHFTLYYYDQAGNLIKTVPPEGVELLALDNTNPNAAALKRQINSDRTYNQKTIFTHHRMATQYEYNSLNQLVKQSMPDHDKMDIFEITLPNGLNAALETHSIQMINSSLGYLSGSISLTTSTFGDITRGYLYQTNDGGVTWKKVNDLVGATLKKVQMIPNSSIGYAVGTGGIILKTENNGDSWDVLTAVYDVNVTDDLNDLHFINVNEGVIVGDNGRILKTTNGGSGFTTYLLASVPGPLPFYQTLTGITHDGNQYYVSVTSQFTSDAPIIGQVYSSVNAMNPPQWNLENLTKTVNMANTSFYDVNMGYAAGEDGRLIQTTNGGISWSTVATNVTYNFKQVIFKDADEGIALLETSAGVNELFATHDKGATWTILSEPDHNYTQLYLYFNDSSYGAKAVAVGKDELVQRVIMENNTPFGIIDLNSPQSNADFTACWGEELNGDLHLVVGANNIIYYTSNGQDNVATWSSQTNLLAGKHPVRIEAEFVGVGDALCGNIITNTNHTYTLFKINGNSTIGIDANASFNGTEMADLAIDKANDRMYAFDNTSKLVYRIDLNDAAPNVQSVVILPQVSPITDAVSVSFNNSKLIITGTNNEIFTGTINSGATDITGGWQNRSLNVRSLSLRDVHYDGSTVYAGGIDGTVLQRNTSGEWSTLITSLNENINRLYFSAPTSGLVAGDNGLLQQFLVNGNLFQSNSLNINGGPVIDDLFDIVGNNNLYYVVGANGTVLYTPDITTNDFATTNQNTTNDFYGLAIKPNTSQAYAMGEYSKIHLCIGASKNVIKNIFTPGLKDVHFADANNGTVIGNNYTIRKTKDGGVTWSLVLPSNGVTNGIILNEVQTIDGNYSLVVGNNKYLGVIENGISTNNSNLVNNPPSDLLSIAFDPDDLNGYIGNSKSKLLGLSLIPNGNSYALSVNNYLANSNAPANTKINALYVFDNGSVMVAGNNNFARYYNQNTDNWTIFSLPVTGATFRDIYFHDHLNGYLVGDNGVILKSKDATLNSDGFLSSITWDPKDIIDDLNITINTQANINAIAFATRYNGVWGGKYATTFTNNTQYPYVRLIRDESELFSTYFFYDKLGRIVVSQNTKQFNAPLHNPVDLRRYSYTLYDELGRVVEAGEKSENTSANEFKTIFGTTIANHFNPKVIDDAKLNLWISDNSGARKEVTQSYYDETVIAGLPSDFTPNIETQRKRITHVTYEEVFDGLDQTYDHATHYDYDIHGNVKTLLQDNQKLLAFGSSLLPQRFKRIDYNYDLISGNVHSVSYQNNEADQWHHAYEYDSDNRITDVYTANNNLIALLNGEIATPMMIGQGPIHTWDQDASYEYYAHGPLARVEIGDLQVQGVDYVYTLQGWIKGVNSNTLNTTNDPGLDGTGMSATNLNALFARDVYGYSLNYFTGDYQSIDPSNHGANSFTASISGSDVEGNRYDLFNGNIGSMVTTITNPTTREILPLGNAYKYDQLNRLLQAVSYDNLDINPASGTFNEFGSSGTQKYFNNFQYDANGNILKQWRKDNANTEIDSLSYKYARNGNGQIIQNRLYQVRDRTDYNNNDIDDMGAFDGNLSTINSNNNYSYSEIGELEKDEQEEIDQIIYGEDSKVKEVIRTTGSSKKNLKFDYDAMGDRVAKHVYSSANVWEKSTFYVRDANGNVMSVYEQALDVPNMSVSFTQTEKHIYGMGRIGMSIDERQMIAPIIDNTNYSRVLGNKHYELVNHLSSTLSVISDKKIPVESTTTPGEVEYFLSDIVVANDFSSFGVTLEGRDFSSENYRYGFQNQERDDEMKGEGNSVNFTYRMHDPRLGRFFVVDPVAEVFAYNSTYAFSENRVNDCIEFEGLEAIFVHGVAAHPLSQGMKGNQPALRDEFFRISGNSAFNDEFNWKIGRRVNKKGQRKGRLMNKLWPRKKDLENAADMLIEHTLNQRNTMIQNGTISKEEPITLIGLSGGGPVAIIAANKLTEMGYDVNVITYNAPAAKGRYEEAVPTEGINKFLEFTTKGDPVPARWFAFKRKFDNSAFKYEEFMQIELNNNHRFIGKHLSKNAPVDDIKDMKIDPLYKKGGRKEPRQPRSRPSF